MKSYAFGVDLGGTTVKIGLFRTDGELVYRHEIPTRKEKDGAYILGDIAKAVKKDLADRQQELTAAAEELKATRLMIKQQTLAISGNYEVYMGKEFVSPTALARMDTLMDEKGLATIGEALDAYKAEKQAK